MTDGFEPSVGQNFDLTVCAGLLDVADERLADADTGHGFEVFGDSGLGDVVRDPVPVTRGPGVFRWPVEAADERVAIGQRPLSQKGYCQEQEKTAAEGFVHQCAFVLGSNRSEPDNVPTPDGGVEPEVRKCRQLAGLFTGRGLKIECGVQPWRDCR